MPTKRSTPRPVAGDATPAGSIWGRPERAGRGPRPAHTRDQITAIAIAVADAEGIEAASIRRVATELGSGATSLYRYFENKDELFELMNDAVIGEIQLTPRTGDWRSDLRTVAVEERALLKRHPWVLSTQGIRSGMGPNTLAWAEHALSTIDDLGLDIDEMLVMVGSVRALARGYVLEELNEQEATRRSGLDTQAWMDSIGPYFQQVLESGRYPRVFRVMLDAEAPHATDRADRDFALGLERLLDGIAAGIEHLGPRR